MTSEQIVEETFHRVWSAPGGIGGPGVKQIIREGIDAALAAIRQAGGMTPERREYIRKVRNCVPLVNCDSGAGVPETQQAFDELLQSHDALAAQLAERDQTIAGLREWRAFLMSAGDSLWLTFGADAVEAAKALPVAEEAVSVSGTFDCRTPIDLRRNLWPYFTAWPRVTRSLPLPSPPAAEGE